jgi:xanthine/CO dehydrogenase XdhC/CoxF family maturation factor
MRFGPILGRGDRHMTDAADTPYRTAAAWLAEGRSVAVATVIETWGSAPQPVGATLVIDGDGRFEGSVSGGCVEGAVVAEARRVLETGAQAPTVLGFGVTDEQAWDVGLACGGTIRVLVEPLTATGAPGA